MSGFSTLLGGGGANVGGLQKKQGELINRSNALAELLLNNYNEQARSGAYDPNAQLQQLGADSAYASKIQSGNAAANARTLGYKPGDTAPLQAQAAIGQRATLDYSRLANQIRGQAVDRQTSALGQAVGGASGIYGQGIGAYGQQISQGLQQQAQQGNIFGSLLGAAMPFLGPAGAATSVLGAGRQFQAQRPGSFLRY